jgi:hypothetical protein
MQRVMGVTGVVCAASAGAAVSLLLALGCGGGSTSSASGGSGGAAHGGASAGMSSGGSTAGGSGGAAGSVSGGMSSSGTGGMESFATETEACAAYIDGYCDFLARCEGANVDTCKKNAVGTCPDIVFAPGSSRTLEGLKGCREQIANWSCSRWAASDVPPCITPGTRQVGEPCRFHAQCESLWCTGSADMCGVCAESAAPGGACDPMSADHPIACPLGQVCIGQACLPETQLDLHLEPGDACDEEIRFCDPKYWCDGGKCAARPAVGSACTDASRCALGAVCNPTSQKCEPAPGVGQPCFDAQVQQICAPDAVCDGKLCQPIEGSACAGACIDKDYNCLNGFCHARTKNVRGSACASGIECADGFVCDNSVCKVAADYHDVCDDTVVCPPASTCTAGKCEPDGSQGLFEMVCK